MAPFRAQVETIYAVVYQADEVTILQADEVTILLYYTTVYYTILYYTDYTAILLYSILYYTTPYCTILDYTTIIELDTPDPLGFPGR